MTVLVPTRSRNLFGMINQWEGNQASYKDHMRKEIATWFESALRGMGSPRIFSMPSSNWQFEQVMLRRLEGANFVCVERDPDIIIRGLTRMPGERREAIDLVTNIGTIKGVHSTRAKMMNCDARTLLSVTTQAFNSNLDSRSFVKNYKCVHAMWLDFNSNIHDALGETLARVEHYLDYRRHRVPVAVTFMAGRESQPMSDDQRRGWVTQMLSAGRWGFRTVRPVRWLESINENGTRMFTGFFDLTLRKSPIAPRRNNEVL